MIDNVDPWFFWWLLSLAAAAYLTLKFAHGIEPYDEGQPRTPGADYTDHFVCGVTNCHNPADGWNDAEHAYMCDDCAIELAAHRKRYPKSRDTL